MATNFNQTCVTLKDMDNFEAVKHAICFKLLNPKIHAEELIGVPSIPFLNLSIAFYVMLQKGRRGEASITTKITDEIAAKWGVTANKLYAEALKSMPTVCPPACYTMNAQQLYPPTDGGQHATTLILTTDIERFGAAAILYTGVAEKLASVVGGDYIALPSSVHEMMIFAHDGTQVAKEVNQMLYEGNRTVCEPDEVLSDQAYLYTQKDAKIVMLEG